MSKRLHYALYLLSSPCLDMRSNTVFRVVYITSKRMDHQHSINFSMILFEEMVVHCSQILNRVLYKKQRLQSVVSLRFV